MAFEDLSEREKRELMQSLDAAERRSKRRLEELQGGKKFKLSDVLFWAVVALMFWLACNEQPKGTGTPEPSGRGSPEPRGTR